MQERVGNMKIPLIPKRAYDSKNLADRKPSYTSPSRLLFRSTFWCLRQYLDELFLKKYDIGSCSYSNGDINYSSTINILYFIEYQIEIAGMMFRLKSDHAVSLINVNDQITLIELVP